jgi:hypothetical protein
MSYANTRRGRRPAAKKTTAEKKPYPKAKPKVTSAKPKVSSAKNPPKASVNTKTNRDYDAAPGATNQNPRARAVSMKKDVTGGVKTKAGTYKTYKKKSAAAKSFRSAFADAKKTGYKTFTWNGKKYSTKTK